MSLLPFLQAVSNWGPIVLVRDSKYGMPAVQSLHLVGLMMLLTTVIAIDLRLSGLGLRDYPIFNLSRQLRPWTLGSIVLVISSGLLIFLATPGKYLDSRPFRLKMVLLACALLFHFLVLRRFTAQDSVARSRLTNIIVACVSVTLWFGVGWSGRAIAFIP